MTDTFAPTVWKNAVDLDGAPAFTVTFNEDVAAAPLAGLVLTNLTTGQQVPSGSIRRTYDAVSHTLALGFADLPGGVPADGNYRLTLPAAAVVDRAGNAAASDFSADFFFLAGDVNGDRSVNFADLVVVAQNYGNSVNGYARGDLDGDGVVGFGDLVIVAQRYDAALPPPHVAPVAALAGAPVAAAVTAPVRTAPPVIRVVQQPVKKPAPPPKKVNRSPFAARRIV